MKIIAAISMVIVSVVIFSTMLVPIVSDVEAGTTVDVIVVDGQSNAEDWGSFATEINTYYHEAPVKHIYYYGSPTSTTHYADSQSVIDTYGVQPMYSDGAWVIGGYGPALCNGYAAKNGHDVFYVNIGCSGQSIQALEPEGSRGVWGFNILDEALDEIREMYDHLNMIGWIWAQGEADKTTSVDDYIADFDKVQSKFDSYGLDECYIIHTREYYGGNATTAQQQIADSDPNVTMTCLFTEDFTEEDGDLRSDGPIHYSQKGRIKIADALVEIIPKKVVNLDDSVNNLIGVIPILVLIGIVIGVIAMIYPRRE